MEYVTLNNDIRMPVLGYGVYQISPQECEKCVLSAISTGYRLIDTAQAYVNEESVGSAIEKCGVPRNELFITTKVWISNSGYEQATTSIINSLKRLNTDYIDLVLIHQPFGDYYGTYRAMEKAYKEGWIRAIGVSNFYPERLTDLCLNAEVVPTVNQIECHPFFSRNDALENMSDYNVKAQAWSPLAEGKFNIFTHSVLTAIGEKYSKSPAQIALRWNIQRGVTVIPKSAHKNRMAENLDIFDFNLTDSDMEEISKLDMGHSEIINHLNPETVKRVCGLKIRN